MAEFGPVALKVVRQSMIDAGLCRSVINSRVNRIRRAFRWGVENQIVAPPILQGVQAVAALKQGRGPVKEREPVKPVNEASIEAVLKVLPSQLAAMVRLQLLTGMRPGEVVRLRNRDLDTSGDIWVYTPFEHKTQHCGRSRRVHLGPQAQALLMAFRNSPPDEFLFSPRPVMVERRRKWRLSRRTPLTPSQRAKDAQALTKLTIAEQAVLFDAIDRRESMAPGSNRRGNRRFTVKPPRSAVAHLESPEGGQNCPVLMRNLSASGYSFLYSVFLYPQTVCNFELQTIDTSWHSCRCASLALWAEKLDWNALEPRFDFEQQLSRRSCPEPPLVWACIAYGRRCNCYPKGTAHDHRCQPCLRLRR